MTTIAIDGRFNFAMLVWQEIHTRVHYFLITFEVAIHFQLFIHFRFAYNRVTLVIHWQKTHWKPDSTAGLYNFNLILILILHGSMSSIIFY